MNVFIIPSWYPSATNAVSGIFFREQAVALSNHFADINIGVSSWGQNDDRLLLWARSPIRSLKKLAYRPKPTYLELNKNLIEYFTPAFTWSRKFAKGNIEGILQANLQNLLHFQERMGKVDLIHAHVAHPGGYVAMLLAEKFNIPYVITEHMSPFPFTTFQKGNNLSDWIKVPLTRSTLNIVVSHALKVKMEQYGINSVVIPNLVDGELFSPKKTTPTQNTIEILSIGRLEEQKGYSYLLEAFQKVVQHYPEAKLQIIGTGSLKSQLVQKANSLDLQDSVIWPGEQTRKQVSNALQGCTFLAMASLHENLPLVLLEAIACGKPIVATRCEGPEDIVNERNGRLAEPGNADDLYQQMMQLINQLDTYDCAVIRQDFENRYSSEVITSKLVKAYQACINKKPFNPE